MVPANDQLTLFLPSHPHILVHTYLIEVSSFRWSYLLYQLVNYYTNPPASKAPLWDIVKLGVIVFQNAAFLEVNLSLWGLI